MRRFQLLRFCVFLLALSAFYVTGIFVRGRYGVGVFIRNKSHSTLCRVRVVAEDPEGRSTREVKDIPADTTSRTFLPIVRKSTIYLEFTDAIGTQHREDIFPYAGGGAYGNTNVTVLPDLRMETNANNCAGVCRKSWLAFF